MAGIRAFAGHQDRPGLAGQRFLAGQNGGLLLPGGRAGARTNRRELVLMSALGSFLTQLVGRCLAL
jgi:hypothetical protein